MPACRQAWPWAGQKTHADHGQRRDISVVVALPSCCRVPKVCIEGVETCLVPCPQSHAVQMQRRAVKRWGVAHNLLHDLGDLQVAAVPSPS